MHYMQKCCEQEEYPNIQHREGGRQKCRGVSCLPKNRRRSLVSIPAEPNAAKRGTGAPVTEC